MAKCIMLQGTSSHVGKSIVTTALCRIFRQNGEAVVPFKAQNMALNSYVTKNGEEMGRAQVAQAEAAGLEPIVEMNPVLLKPTGNACSQVILMGKSVGNMSAKEYHQGYSLKAFSTVKTALSKLTKDFDTIVIEGAGSPAEVNLKANDIVNMRIAKYLNAPVLLIADIDRGGALASLVGTLELLDEEERDLVKGLIINKFRGDIRLLEPALTFLEEKTGKPVLGVIPHLDNLGIDDEDSVSLDEKNIQPQADKVIKIVVLRTPKIANFTDFDCLANEVDVALSYIQNGDVLGQPDLIILPGSKNTTEDLLYLRTAGYEAQIKAAYANGVPIIGICGGYQMLGKVINDPQHTESALDSIEGIGLLPTATTFVSDKLTRQVIANYDSSAFLATKIVADQLHGYEIHMGRTEFLAKTNQPLTINEDSGRMTNRAEGCVSDDGLVFGTYVHGIFDNDDFRRAVLNILRQRKNLSPLENTVNTAAQKQYSYNRLADTVRQNLDMELLQKIMDEQQP